jgi:hypothetical protein
VLKITCWKAVDQVSVRVIQVSAGENEFDMDKRHTTEHDVQIEDWELDSVDRSMPIIIEPVRHEVLKTARRILFGLPSKLQNRVRISLPHPGIAREISAHLEDREARWLIAG